MSRRYTTQTRVFWEGPNGELPRNLLGVWMRENPDLIVGDVVISDDATIQVTVRRHKSAGGFWFHSGD